MVQTRETVDVETAGATVTLEKPGDDVVNVRVVADGAIDAELKVSDRNPADDNSPFTETTYSATSDVDDTGRAITERYVEFEVTTGTATANDTADVLLSSAGGRN